MFWAVVNVLGQAPRFQSFPEPVAVEGDGLTGEDSGELGCRAGVDAGCVEVAFGASDKEGPGRAGTPHWRRKAHGIELGGLCAETGFDVAQALAIGQLGKVHGADLFGASEVAAMQSVLSIMGAAGEA